MIGLMEDGFKLHRSLDWNIEVATIELLKLVSLKLWFKRCLLFTTSKMVLLLLALSQRTSGALMYNFASG